MLQHVGFALRPSSDTAKLSGWWCTDACFFLGYHPAGTCKMGHDDDPMAVLDSELRVRGVKNLRVADASVMPLLMCGHPQMACYAIGEKAADLIKASA